MTRSSGVPGPPGGPGDAEAPVAVVILCGGTSRRMGGTDKTAMELTDGTVLGTLVDSLPPAWPVVCVGDERPLPRAVRWTREDPPLGGPVAGLLAGVDRAGRARVVIALAGDQPFGGPAAVACAAELERRAELDGVAARQRDGRLQALLAAYRWEPLVRALRSAPEGAGVHRTLAGLHLDGLLTDPAATLDVDTPHDLRAARLATAPQEGPPPPPHLR